jgi:rhamnosyl/mannosyltransferase
MRILLVNKAYHPRIGGVETVVRQLAAGMARAGHEVSVLCFGEENAAERLDGASVVRVRGSVRVGSAPLGWRFVPEFRELAAGADVVNLHAPNPMGEMAALACIPRKRAAKRPKIICTYHGDAQRPGLLLPGYDFMMRRFFLRCDAVAVTSPRLAENSRVLRPLRAPGGSVRVIPIGVRSERYKNAAPDDLLKAKALLNPLPADSFKVMFAGRMVYYKGLRYLVAAMGALKNRGVRASAFLLGEGPLEGEVRSLIASEGLERDVIALPHQPDGVYRALFHQADCFVLPSCLPTEAYGIVLLEAMASGLPVISTELGTGASWVNEDGSTGLVVPPRDADAIASAVEFLASREAERERMALAAVRRVENFFEEDDMLRAYSDLFTEAADAQ